MKTHGRTSLASGLERWLAIALLVLAAAVVPARPALAQDEDPVPASSKPGIAFDRSPSGNILVYRRVSDWEMRQIKKRGGLFVTPGSGESFVSTSRAYVDQLGARHPKDYANLMVIEVDPAALPELEKIGLKASGPVTDQLYPKMPKMEAGRPDAVHFKGELGALNLGFREGSIPVFNRFVKKIAVDEDARLTVPRNAGSIKQGERDRRAALRAARGLNSQIATGPDATEADVANFAEHVARHDGTVERVEEGDPRLPDGASAHTTLGPDGRPLVLLPEGGVKKLALVEELTHVIQLAREVARTGAAEVGQLLDDARDGVDAAVAKVERWEVDAHKLMLHLLGIEGEARVDVAQRLAEHERILDDAEARAPVLEDLARLSIPELVLRNGGRIPEGELSRASLIAAITGAEVKDVETQLAALAANGHDVRPGASAAEPKDRLRERDRTTGPREARGFTGELAKERVSGERGGER